ncbi:hypothetical protein [Nocardia sp. NPDC004123]
MASITSLAEAVSELVEDGYTVALEGFTHLIPVAAGHEIIRQLKHDLTLVRMTPDIRYDQMIGAGCARKLIFFWGGNPGVGPLHRAKLGLLGHGPTLVITDLGVMQPDSSGELVLTAVHPGVDVGRVQAAAGWELRAAPDLGISVAPTAAELAALRALKAAS